LNFILNYNSSFILFNLKSSFTFPLIEMHSFCFVSQGNLSDGTTVAVKHLTKSQQGVDDFLNEVIVITGVRHRNLVKLKGCCVHGTQRFLVFEYVENSNLVEALWGMLF
jgi:hypothetical protein